MNTPTPPDIPFIPAPRITTVTGYLVTRLAQAGVRSIFGVPGDDPTCAPTPPRSRSTGC